MLAVDLETCSWCVAEVPFSTLREVLDDGALICRDCVADHPDRKVGKP